MEIWKDINGYEGYYRISNKGRVKSLIGFNGHKYIEREKMLNPYKQTSTPNYSRLVVKLVKDRHKKDFKVHQLVAKAFIPNPNNYKMINHLDGNPFNNNVKNLEWCTAKQNTEHAIKTGLIKIREYDKDKLESLYAEKTSREVADIYGVSIPTILRAIERHGLKKKPTGGPIKFNITKELLEKELKNKTQTQLANELGCDPSLISHYVKKMNLGGF